MWIEARASELVVPFVIRIDPMRAAMFITAATCAGSVRSTGARTEGGGEVRTSSMVATLRRLPAMLSQSPLNPCATRVTLTGGLRYRTRGADV